MRRILEIGGAVIGLAIAAVFAFMTVLAAFSSPWPLAGRSLEGVTVFGVIALAGAGLAQFSSRRLFQRLAAASFEAARLFASRGHPSNPEGLVFWTFVPTAVLLLIPGPRILIVLAAWIIYLLVSAGMLLIGPRWWYRLVFTLIASFPLVGAMVGLSEWIEPRSIGEGGLAILGPWMISWFVLPALVLARVFVRSLRNSPE